eukprot:gene11823-24788_t
MSSSLLAKILSIMFMYQGSINPIDPFELFQGSQTRPKLEILYPENGQVQDSTDIEIKIEVTGYHFPSQFHDTFICLGIGTTKTGLTEQCSEPVEKPVFFVKGLTAGETYSLRVVFLERKRAIAVSVRSFRVAAIKGLLDDTDTPVSIQSAVQIAIKKQLSGMFLEAEQIYRTILAENPSHPDALHLLGLIFYQQGDPFSAIPYIEKAVLSNTSFDNFHNSLGECFRSVGRLEEAKEQFQLALSRNEQHTTAVFNLGLTYQGLNDWDKAIEQYRTVSKDAVLHPGVVEERIRTESKTRECDLLQALDRIADAVKCWAEAAAMFPNNALIYNELGNLQAKVGAHDAAVELYSRASSLGLAIAQYNLANVVEMQGFFAESKVLFEAALARAETQGVPSYHIKIRLSTVLPRIPLGSDADLLRIRHDMDIAFDALLAHKNVIVDNSPPLYNGFATGHFLTYHGFNNVALKSKLYRVYLRYCPALTGGIFLQQSPVGADGMSSSRQYQSMVYPDNNNNNNKGTVKGPGSGNMQRLRTHSNINSSSSSISSSVSGNITTGLSNSSQTTSPDSIINVTVDEQGNTVYVDDGNIQESLTATATISPMSAPNITSISSTITTTITPPHKLNRRMRIGFVSKHFTPCSVGYLVQGLIPALVQAGHDIYIFAIDGEKTMKDNGAVLGTMKTAALSTHLLPEDMN